MGFRMSSTPPGPLAPTRTISIPRPDATLHAEWFAPAAPRGLVVVSHGYAEHCGRYREVANVLVRAGAAVLTYDCRGHGQSTGARGHVARFSDYLDDLEAAVAWGRGAIAELGVIEPRVLLLGHSHGSLIVLRALTDRGRSTGAVAAVVSSPFLGLRLAVSPIKKGAARLIARIHPGLTMANELQIEHLTTDEGKLAERRADTLCHDVATAGWFVAAQQAQAHVAHNAAQIDVPTQWLVGGADPIADPSRSRAVADAVRGAPVEYHDLAGLKHEVLNERTRGEVFDLLTRFVGQHLPLGDAKHRGRGRYEDPAAGLPAGGSKEQRAPDQKISGTERCEAPRSGSVRDPADGPAARRGRDHRAAHARCSTRGRSRRAQDPLHRRGEIDRVPRPIALL